MLTKRNRLSVSRKISNLLTEYFEPERTLQPAIQQFNSEKISQSPVVPRPCQWQVHSDPERFSRDFSFESRDRLRDFVHEVLLFEEDLNHHGEIRVSGKDVSISVYTHTINRITNLDKEYTRNIDNIYKDVLDFEY